MSERDEDIRVILAGLAMNGLLAGHSNLHADHKVESGITYARDIALDAVAHADALIKALNEFK